MKTNLKTFFIMIPLLALLVGGLLLWQPGPSVSYAEQTTDETVVLENGSGQEMVIQIEDEIPAEERAMQDSASMAGAIDLGDDAVPLAGFDAIGAGDSGSGQVHLIWMILALLAAIAYAVYFSWYQNRMFELRRRVAQAEHALRKDRR